MVVISFFFFFLVYWLDIKWYSDIMTWFWWSHGFHYNLVPLIYVWFKICLFIFIYLPRWLVQNQTGIHRWPDGWAGRNHHRRLLWCWKSGRPNISLPVWSGCFSTRRQTTRKVFVFLQGMRVFFFFQLLFVHLSWLSKYFISSSCSMLLFQNPLRQLFLIILYIFQFHTQPLSIRTMAISCYICSIL